MPNQHAPENQRYRARILAYVRAHPECTTKDIRAAFAIGLDQIGCCLTRMKAAGLVTSEKLPNNRELRWTAVDEEQIDGLPLRQVTVKTWAPCHVRDFLVSASLWPARVAA